jgi:ABC-type polar amino acid transport system ATPase subunit
MSNRVLQIRGLCLRRGTRDILRGVDLHAERGELVALMGLSGGGKTTVLRAVAGLDAFDAGSIDLEEVRLESGRIPHGAIASALRSKVGLVFQLHHLFEHLSALHNVWLAPVHVRREARAHAAERAQQLLDQLGVGHRARALPRELSGGEAQRVAIARALAMEPPLLLSGLTRAGRTLLIATHDDEFARGYATRVVILAEGIVVEQGAPEQVLRDPRHPATRALLAANRGADAAVAPQT